MPVPDAASEFLVKLALNDAFRKDFNATQPDQREAFLTEKLHEFGALDPKLKQALVNADVEAINNHVFFNQQTSHTAARSMVKALDAFLATLESEAKKPR